MDPVMIWISWFCFTIGVVFIANEKNISFTKTMIWCILFSPIIGFIMVLSTSSKSKKTTS